MGQRWWSKYSLNNQLDAYKEKQLRSVCQEGDVDKAFKIVDSCREKIKGRLATVTMYELLETHNYPSKFAKCEISWLVPHLLQKGADPTIFVPRYIYYRHSDMNGSVLTLLSTTSRHRLWQMVLQACIEKWKTCDITKTKMLEETLYASYTMVDKDTLSSVFTSCFDLLNNHDRQLILPKLIDQTVKYHNTQTYVTVALPVMAKHNIICENLEKHFYSLSTIYHPKPIIYMLKYASTLDYVYNFKQMTGKLFSCIMRRPYSQQAYQWSYPLSKSSTQPCDTVYMLTLLQANCDVYNDTCQTDILQKNTQESLPWEFFEVVKMCYVLHRNVFAKLSKEEFDIFSKKDVEDAFGLWDYPLRLKEWSRIIIRRHLGGEFLIKVKILPLPEVLQDYLMMTEYNGLF